MQELDILAALAKRELPSNKGSGVRRRFPVYIARDARRHDHCGHQHDTPGRAANCAKNHGFGWIVLEARADGTEREVRA
jgi:hypothetical protein